MEIEIILLVMGFLISKLSGKHYRLDCICGEIAGIGFIILISYILHECYGVGVEPVKVAKLLLGGYLPSRIVEWWWRKEWIISLISKLNEILFWDV